MLWLDVKYAKMISYRLKRWKIKKDTGNNFQAVGRCPICGDSQKSETKTRGNFYAQDGNLHYKCFNCEAAMFFGTFLKQFDANVYSEYAFEKFKERGNSQIIHTETKKEEKGTEQYFYLFDSIKTIKDLADDHPAKKYVLGRKIPEYFLSKLYYAPKFFKWAGEHTDKFKDVIYNDHPRLIIPWFDKNGNCFAYHARAFDPNDKMRYFSVVLDKTVEKVYGLERLDENAPIIVVEGQIDSMFLPNCVAVGNATLYSFDRPGKDITYVFDVQPRNPEIVKIIKKAIDMGKKVVLLNEEDFPWKDINEAVVAGVDVDFILELIHNNTYSGLQAEMKFTQWRKV